MTEQEYLRKKPILTFVEHPDFESIFEDMRNELAQKMIHEEKEEERAKIYYEAKCIDSLVGRLIGIANEVRVYNG